MLKKNCLVLFLGFLFGFLFLELVLRFFGVIYKSKPENINVSKEEIVIVCLGESMTALGGKNSYPSQLEKILNQKSGLKKIKVVNLALPMTNSWDMVENFIKNVDKFNPDIVIAMLGINDKSFKYYDRLFCNKGEKKFSIVKIFNFFAILVNDVATKIKSKPIFKKNENYINLFEFYERNKDFNAAENVLKQAVKKFPKQSLNYIFLYDLYARNDRKVEGEDILKKGLKTNPESDLIAVKFSWVKILKGDKYGAINLINSVVERNSEKSQSYVILGRFYKSMGEYEKAIECFKKSISINVHNIEANEELELLISNEYLNAITKNSYNFLYEFLSTKGIQCVFLGYPIRSSEPLKKMFAKKSNIIFVDNELVFKNAVKRDGIEKYFIDMFAGDFGHCTKQGNELLAENISIEILKYLNRVNYFK